MKLNNKKIAFVFIFCYLIIVWRVLFVPAQYRTSIFGDGFSDKNTISSAHFFLDSGFTKTKFLPVHEYPPIINACVYTHYPALPNILAGFYAKIFQSNQEQILRIIPVLLSIMFFFLIFFILKNVSQDKKNAFVAAVMIVLSNYFIAWADNLHKHLYEEILNWTYFLLLYQYHESDRTKKWIAPVLFVIMIVGINISFEQPVFLGVLTLGFAIIYQKKVFTLETIGAFIALVFGFSIHLFQNYLYFGTLEKMYSDMKDAFVFRNTGQVVANYVPERPFNFAKDFLEIPFSWFNRMERYFIIPGWGLLIMSYWGIKKLFIENRRKFYLLIVSFCAAASWSFVMPQHDFIHTFTNRHFGLFYALVLTFCFSPYLEKLKSDFSNGKLWQKIFHILLLTYCTAMIITQQVWDLYLKNGIAFTFFNH
jgi:hypothetical protein